MDTTALGRVRTTRARLAAAGNWSAGTAAYWAAVVRDCGGGGEERCSTEDDSDSDDDWRESESGDTKGGEDENV